jgi:hypothetical protein
MIDLALGVINLVLILLGSAYEVPTAPRSVEPMTVHDVPTATDEEIAAAAVELPELRGRSKEALERARQ